MKFMHAIYNNVAPPSFTNVWQKNNIREQQYDLRNQDIFIIPKPRFEGFKKYPLYSFAKTWNESGDLRLYNNFVTFKMALKKPAAGAVGPIPIEDNCKSNLMNINIMSPFFGLATPCPSSFPCLIWFFVLNIFAGSPRFFGPFRDDIPLVLPVMGTGTQFMFAQIYYLLMLFLFFHLS